MGEGEILKVQEERDLGVIIQDNLESESHVNRIFGDTYRVVRNIGITFHYMYKEFKNMIKKKDNYHHD